MQRPTLHQNLQELLRGRNPKLFAEYTFFSTRRIGDLFWPEERLVFEIQSSPITLEEVLNRTRDYAQEGCTVVWLLDERRFNKKRLGAAEEEVRRGCSYFFSQQGRIYDQYELIEGGRRLSKGPKLPIDLLQPIRSLEDPPALRHLRGRKEGLYFKGDLYDKALNRPSYLKSLLDYEDALIRKFAKKEMWAGRLKQLGWMMWERLLRSVCRS